MSGIEEAEKGGRSLAGIDPDGLGHGPLIGMSPGGDRTHWNEEGRVGRLDKLSLNDRLQVVQQSLKG